MVGPFQLSCWDAGTSIDVDRKIHLQMLLLCTLLLPAFNFMKYYHHFILYIKAVQLESLIKLARTVSENDILTGGSVLDKWLSFKPVIFVLSLYRAISKQTCLGTSGLSEHAFTGNFYCLSSSGTEQMIIYQPWIIWFSWFTTLSCARGPRSAPAHCSHLNHNSRNATQALRVYPCGWRGEDLCMSCMPCMVMQAVLYLDVSLEKESS